MLEMHLTPLTFYRESYVRNALNHFVFWPFAFSHLSPLYTPFYIYGKASEARVETMKIRLRFCDTRRVPDRLSTISGSTLQE